MLASAIEDLALGLAGDALLSQKTAASSSSASASGVHGLVHSAVAALVQWIADMKVLARNRPELLDKCAKRIRVYV